MKNTIFALMLALCTLVCAAAMADSALITLDGDKITTDAQGVTMDGSTAIITVPGEYTITGTLDNGQIIVRCEEEGKSTLTLKNASIQCEGKPAICVEKSQNRVTIRLEEGSVSKLSGGVSQKPADGDETPVGVIYSKANLTISGEGQLIVTAAGVDGIVGKDDIRIKSGTLSVSAPRHGIRAKDSVEISGGTITVEAGKDGIKATSTKDSDHGYITVTGGLVTLDCGDDAFSYTSRLSVTSGMVVASVKSENAAEETTETK